MNRTKYNAKFCDQIVQHMAEGNTLKSFAGVVSVSEKTVHNWKDRYPAFREAVQVGECKRETFMLQLGRMMCTGQLRRTVKEEAILGPDGRPLYDERGKVLMRKEYAYTNGNAAVWIFLMKNYGWRDTRELKHGGDPANPVKVRHEYDSLDDEQLAAEAERFRQMRMVADEEIPDGSERAGQG